MVSAINVTSIYIQSFHIYFEFYGDQSWRTEEIEGYISSLASVNRREKMAGAVGTSESETMPVKP